ncbi:MAG: hypothetical protein Tsb0017_20790 [Geothermobacteraceae bacterium]
MENDAGTGIGRAKAHGDPAAGVQSDAGDGYGFGDGGLKNHGLWQSLCSIRLAPASTILCKKQTMAMPVLKIFPTI